jgi:hypothetical protein
LLEIVGALGSASGFSRRLDSWKQQRHQNADDGDDDKYLNKCERAAHRRRVL